MRRLLLVTAATVLLGGCYAGPGGYAYAPSYGHYGGAPFYGRGWYDHPRHVYVPRHHHHFHDRDRDRDHARGHDRDRDHARGHDRGRARDHDRARARGGDRDRRQARDEDYERFRRNQAAADRGHREAVRQWEAERRRWTRDEGR